MKVHSTDTTNGYQSTMSNPHKDWLVQEQTAPGKDFPNPFIVDNLLKNVWFSTHHIILCVKSWLVHMLWYVVKT